MIKGLDRRGYNYESRSRLSPPRTFDLSPPRVHIRRPQSNFATEVSHEATSRVERDCIVVLCSISQAQQPVATETTGSSRRW